MNSNLLSYALAGSGLLHQQQQPGGAVDTLDDGAMSEGGASGGLALGDKSAILKLKGLPYNTSREQLLHFFDGFNLKDLAFVYEPDGRPSGLAFAEFHSRNDAVRAMAKNGQYIGDRYVKLLLVSRQEMEEQVTLGTLAIPSRGRGPQQPQQPQPVRAVRPPTRPEAAADLRAQLDMRGGGLNLPAAAAAAMNLMVNHAPHKAPLMMPTASHRPATCREEVMQQQAAQLHPNHGFLLMQQMPHAAGMMSAHDLSGSSMMNPSMQLQLGGGMPSAAQFHFSNGAAAEAAAQQQQLMMLFNNQIPPIYGGRTVKVRGMPFRSTPAEILQFFAGFDYVPETLFIGRDAFGRPSGEAWLAFTSPHEALRAVTERNRQYLRSRYLELSLC